IEAAEPEEDLGAPGSEHIYEKKAPEPKPVASVEEADVIEELDDEDVIEDLV
ncbi:MAG: hypothetical protein GWO23_17675, partial [Gammaproteobacteria bacterium]|nr:hypothetical protein [Gammaproteobacteria bacterium]